MTDTSPPKPPSEPGEKEPLAVVDKEVANVLPMVFDSMLCSVSVTGPAKPKRRPARRCMRASELVMMMSKLNRIEFEHSRIL